MENNIICGDCVIVKKKPKRICIHDGCYKQATYNFIGESRPQYCGGHKQPDMVDVKNKKCEHENCNKRPIFNYENETNGILCAEHMKPEMVNVKNKKCEHECCNKIPNFNNPNETVGKFCNEHKQPEMVDVKNKRCEHEGCNKRPSFNYPNKKDGGFCAEHKQTDMVNVIHKMCKHEGCNKRPYFNNQNETVGKFCNGHKQPDMINVISKTCKHEWCDTYVSNKKYEGFCMRCYIYKYPDNTITKNYKTKETNVVDFIKTNFPNYTWVADKSVQDGCSRRRPDLLVDFGDFILIIEVDENQHVDYDCSCENKRIMEISRDVGHKPIVFIRFNPDEYTIGDEKITSCWGANGNGICAIKKSKMKEWNERLNALKYWIEYWIENGTDKTVEVVQLFYNDEN